MDVVLKLFVLLSAAYMHCNGVSVRDQLAHIVETRKGIGVGNIGRRFNTQPEGSVILGAPSYPSHLPEAEPILPGHTLIRPALGMLKSAVKFPHIDMENGAGVYGSIDNLGIRYDGKNERLMYSGFRRSPTDFIMIPEEVADSMQLYENQDSDNDMENILVPHKIKSRLPSRLHTSEKTLLFVKEMLKHIHSNRRQRKRSKIIFATREQDRGSKELEQSNEATVISQEDSDKAKKHKLFWKSKDSFNHIKFNPDAPNHEDYLPVDSMDENDLKNWWYYHQTD